MKNKICPTCGTSFTPQYRTSKYCSADCAHIAQLSRQRTYHHNNLNKIWYKLMRLNSRLKRKIDYENLNQ